MVPAKTRAGLIKP